MTKKAVCFIVALVIAAGCKGHKTDPERTSFTVSGTYLTVASPDARAAQIVFNEISRLDKLFDPYSADSELSRLNRAFNVPVKVSPEMIALLNFSAQINFMTGGAFDATSGALSEQWEKFTKSKDPARIPSPAEIAALKKKCGIDYIVIDKNASTAKIVKEGLKINFGGIARGYMVDKAAEKLRTAGINNAFIDYGGNIFCMGKNHGHLWSTGIKNPRALGAILSQEEIQDEGVVTAGGPEQFFTFTGKKYSRIVDHKTGLLLNNNVISVTIITKNCLTAAGFAEPFVIMGELGIKAFLAQNPSTMRIFLLMDENGKPRMSIFR